MARLYRYLVAMRWIAEPSDGWAVDERVSNTFDLRVADRLTP